MIVGVSVAFEGQLFACMAVRELTGFKFKCGKCHRGTVYPIINDKCRVCGAIVAVVDDGPTIDFTPFIDRELDLIYEIIGWDVGSPIPRRRS